MGRRGAQTFEEKIGEDKFKELMNRLDVKGIARLYCDHEIEDADKEKCKACRRTIYRAIKRVKEKTLAEKRYDPMEDFDIIPEIQNFREYFKGKKTVNAQVNRLRSMWVWIKEDPELSQLSRPTLWDERHIRAIISKLKEKQVSLYQPKQVLRRLFESMKSPLQKSKLIGAHRKEMRSPKGARRQKTEFPPSMLPKIREPCTQDEIDLIDTHVTVKCREGSKKGKRVSLLGMAWRHINWEDNFYGFPMATVDIYESKTGGGTWWRHCPLDLWFSDLSERLKAKWERLGKPEGYVFDITYKQLLKLWHKISDHVGQKLEAHDCRRSAGGWLRDLGLSDLALGQYNPVKGEAIGYTGVGWENSEIYFQRYGKMNPKAIYNKDLRLDPSIFTGYIHKIMENRAKQ